MPMPGFPNGLLWIYRGPPTLSNFEMAASKRLKIEFFFAYLSFFTIFTLVKISAKFGTTWKMLNASLLWSCAGSLFECLRIVWGFLRCLRMWTCVRLSLLQVRVLLWVLLCSYFHWVIKILMWSANNCFGVYAYVWWRIRDTLSGEKRGVPRCSFLKIEKITLIMRKNELIVLIHGLNTFIYALI